MVLPGHLAGGYLVTKALISIAHPALTASQETFLYVFGMICGELPDIDIAAFFFSWKFGSKQRMNNHRDYKTHTPITWIILGLLVVGVSALFGSVFFQFIGWTLIAGTISHLILDSIENGVMWLWPLSMKRYALRYVPEDDADVRAGTLIFYWEHVRDRYMTRITFYIEILVTVIAIIVALK